MGFFRHFSKGLKKTRDSVGGAIDEALKDKVEVDDEFYDDLEEILIMADTGMQTAEEIVEELKESVRHNHLKYTYEVKKEIQRIIASKLGGGDMDLVTIPAVLLVIGVNGVGKTTSIGKMANYFKNDGKKVILGAADTFRAAAIDQLQIWADRAGVDMVKHKEGADPAAVVYDTICAAKARDDDIIICDTAGRLHNKKNLMEELSKIYKVIDRELPYADTEILLVLDATTGQNAISQAKEFGNICDLTGIILTKLDGTAKGGVVIALRNELKLPVKFIGVGEGIDDLKPFDPDAFAEAMFVEAPEAEIKDSADSADSEE